MWHIHILADKIEGQGHRALKMYFVYDHDDPPPVSTETIQELIYASLRLTYKAANINFTELKHTEKKRETDK